MDISFSALSSSCDLTQHLTVEQVVVISRGKDPTRGRKVRALTQACSQVGWTLDALYAELLYDLSLNISSRNLLFCRPLSNIRNFNVFVSARLHLYSSCSRPSVSQGALPLDRRQKETHLEMSSASRTLLLFAIEQHLYPYTVMRNLIIALITLYLLRLPLMVTCGLDLPDEQSSLNNLLAHEVKALLSQHRSKLGPQMAHWELSK
ncbi:hypothetical protein B566_EDAN001570, partial [Ephemera danica]